MIKRALFILLMWGCFALAAFGQSTTVSGTITDSGGQVWFAGNWQITFYPSPSNPSGPYFWNGAPFNTQQVFRGSLDTSGAFSGVSLPSSNFITPSGSQWSFQVCSGASANCYTKNLTVTGASLDISALVVPPPITVNAAGVSQLSAYTDASITNAKLGSSYYNLTDNTIHLCNPALLPCTWTSIGGGGGGGGSAGPNGTVQVGNGHGGFVAGNCNDNVTVPGALYCGENVAIKGPRPSVDVTAYGAKGDGVTNDTTAVQTAITAACANQSYVFFPAGNYIISQTQGASTVPDLTPGAGCNGAGHGLYILGEGSNGAGGSFVPQSRITVSNGASPSLAPLFGVTNSGGTYGVGSSRIENMDLNCYNQCFQNLSGGNTKLINDTMYTSNASQVNCSSSGCTTDTAPVAFYGSLENYIEGGTYSNSETATCPTSNCPSIVLGTDASNHASGLIFIGKTILFGQVLDEALTSPSSGWGFVSMRDNIFEGLGNQPAFQTVNFGSVTSFNTLSMDGITLVSDSNSTIPLIQFAGGSFYTGIDVRNVTPSVNGAIIKVVNGELGYCEITSGSASSGNSGVVDNSGNPLIGCESSTFAGKGFTGPSTYVNTQAYYSTFWPPFQFSGAPIEEAVTGENNTRTALDPLMGYLAGPGGTVGGYDLSLRRSADQTLGLYIAQALPPTAITASVTSGGSLTVGTHKFGVVSAVGTTNCNTLTNFWLTASATTTSGNQSVIVGWTLPTNTTNITGYCVLRDPATTSATTAIFVSGATTTSYTDTGTGGTIISGPVINNTFPASPNYSFGPGGATFPCISTPSVFCAASYPGVTVAEQWNACLTAASAVKGTCSGVGLPITANWDENVTVPQYTTMVLPPYFQWTDTITNGTSCALTQDSFSNIIGSAPMYSTNATLKVQASTNQGASYCTVTPSPVTNLSYMNASGIAFKCSASGATNSLGACAVINGVYESHWTDLQVYDDIDTCGMKVGGLQGADRFEGLGIEGVSGAGVTPLCITGTTGGGAIDHIEEFNCFGCSINHPGAGFHNVNIVDGVGSAQFQTQTIVNFYGPRFETNQVSDLTTSIIYGTNAKAINVFGGNAQYQLAGASAPLIEYTYGAGKGTAITIDGFGIDNCDGCTSPVSPVNFVVNDVTSAAVPGDPLGYGTPGWLSHYSSNNSWADTSNATAFDAQSGTLGLYGKFSSYNNGSGGANAEINTFNSVSGQPTDFDIFQHTNAGGGLAYFQLFTGQGVAGNPYLQIHVQDNSGTGAGQNTTYIDPQAASGQTSQVTLFRNVSNGGAGACFTGDLGNGTSTSNFQLCGTGQSYVALNNGCLSIGSSTTCTSGKVLSVGSNAIDADTSGNLSINGNFTLGNGAGSHLNTGGATVDTAGVLTCSTGTISKTFSTAFTSTPVIVVSDETTAGAARVSAKSNTGFTVTCTGLSDVVDFVVVGIPN